MSAITQAGGGAPAQQNGNGGPNLPAGKAIVRRYYKQLAALLPSHVRAENWYSSVLAALDKSAELADAANRNPESLMYALFESARLGLPAGTELYYLTPRPNRRANGGKEVLGMVGYRGDIELIYNAGHVSSVIVEVVRTNDFYRYKRGIDRTPIHEFEPFARNEARGELLGVYAYGEMVSGAVSRVVELNQDDIERAMRSSPTASSSYSPWKTDPGAMWLKTGVHRLRKFVPSSAERTFTSHTMRATAEAVGAAHGDHQRQQLAGAGAAGEVAGPPRGQLPPGTQVVPEASDEQPAISYTPAPPEDEPLNPEQFRQPAAPEDENSATTGDDDPGAGDESAAQDDDRPEQPAAGPDMVTEFAAPSSRGDDPPATKQQQSAVSTIIKRAGLSDEQRHRIAARMAGRTAPVDSLERLTKPEISQVIGKLSEWQDAGTLADQLAAVDRAAQAAAAPVELPAVGSRAWHDAGHPTETLDGSVQTADRVLDGNCGICEQGEES